MQESIFQENKINYSKLLSAFFSSVSIIALMILCLLNNPALDLYSALFLFKIVVPAAVSFWFLGFVIGKKLDGLSDKAVLKQIKNDELAYEIPSMFAASDADSDNLENLDGGI